MFKVKKGSVMDKNELREFVIDAVKTVNAASDDKREELFGSLNRRLAEELEGVDYMEYDGDVVLNRYINFDSNCGLSVITASISATDLLEHADAGKGFSLSEACVTLCDIGERDEFWDDLVDDDTHAFTKEPEDVADVIVSVLDPWIGEAEFCELTGGAR